jgi:hypothetical protein
MASAYVSIRQHTSAYVSMRLEYVSIRPHTARSCHRRGGSSRSSRRRRVDVPQIWRERVRAFRGQGMLTYADVCWRMLTYADVC